MRIRRYGAFICLTLCSTLARAENAPATNSPTARRHFDEGLAQAAHGDLLAALHEFETAYELQPHYSVLYNIGQARAALGRPVEAIAAFEQYLAESGEKLSAARRDEVNTLLQANRGRIGQIRLAVAAPAGTQIWVDGAAIAIDRLQTGVALAAGAHSVLHASPTCPPISQQALIAAGQTLMLDLGPTPECQSSQGLLAIDCDVPGVEVNVVDVTTATTPLTALLFVPIGDVTVRFSRPGYGVVSRSVRVTGTELTRVQCDQLALLPLPLTLAARLLVRKVPASAKVVVDGQPFEGIPLPSGPHDVLVEHQGYLSTTRRVSLEAGKSASIEVILTPTADDAAHARTSRSRRRWLGVGLGGAALGLWGTAGGVYAWNSGRYADWRARAAMQATNGDLKTVASVQRIDDLSLALTLIGAGLAIGGAWFFFQAD